MNTRLLFFLLLLLGLFLAFRPARAQNRTTINTLPAVGNLTDSDVTVVVQGNATKSATIGQIRSLSANQTRAALSGGNGTLNLSGYTLTLPPDLSITGNLTANGTVTFPGDVTMSGNVSLNLPSSLTVQRLNIGNGTMGWRYNAQGTGQMELVFPGGTAAWYETGAPSAPFMYFAGTIQADQIVGNINAVTLNGESLTGVIPTGVIASSLGEIGNWLAGQTFAGVIGVTYGLKGQFYEPQPGSSYYYPALFVIDGGADLNRLESRYRSRAQMLADLMPSATASLDWPSISAGADSSLTITVTGADPTNTPTVRLGWSAALPAGVVVKQARVSASNTVTITLTNISGSPVDPSAVTVRAAISPY